MAEDRSVLHIAEEIISGDRERTYGSPGFNLQSIAQFWQVYLERKNPGVPLNEITMADVCQMMVLLKAARLLNSPNHLDSMVDQCGYIALQQKVKP